MMARWAERREWVKVLYHAGRNGWGRIHPWCPLVCIGDVGGIIADLKGIRVSMHRGFLCYSVYGFTRKCENECRWFVRRRNSGIGID